MSSTAPRFDPRCPPFAATDSTIVSRSSCGEQVERGRVEATEVRGTGDGVEDGHDRAAQRVDAAARSDSRSEPIVASTAVGS